MLSGAQNIFGNDAGSRVFRVTVVALTIGPLAALLLSIWPDMHVFWVSSDAYSHGYLVFAIAVWLAVREARREPLGEMRPSWSGCLVLAGSLVVLVAGQASDVLTLQQLVLPAVPVAALWATTGGRNAGRFVIPAGYCIFAVPVWDLINEPLRSLTTTVVSQLTYMAAIPAYIQGNTINIPSGTFEVEGGCSGLRYFIVACALSWLYGLLSYRRWVPRLAFLAAGALVALVANWVRVFVIIIAGYLTEMQHYLVTVDHYFFGWVLFFVALLPLFLLARPAVAEGSQAPGGTAKRALAPEARTTPLALAVLLLVIAASLSLSVTLRPAAPAASGRATMPAALGEWAYDGVWDGQGAPSFAGAHRSGGARYQRDADSVGLYMASYPVQRQGNEVVYYANLPQGQQDQVVSSSRRRVQVAGDESFDVEELVVEDSYASRRLVWYAFVVAGSPVAGELRAKLYQSLGALRRRWDAQAWVVSTSCETDDCNPARTRLAEFVQDALPHERARAMLDLGAEST